MALTSSLHDLIKNQFASHVCQTLLTLASDVIEREVKGFSTDNPEDPKGASVATMEQIVLDIVDKLQESGNQEDGLYWRSLMSHSHASHILRTLLNLLSGQRLAESQIRSKKSVAYNMNHNTGAMVSSKTLKLGYHQEK
jgi:nucleolar protein 9